MLIGIGHFLGRIKCQAGGGDAFPCAAAGEKQLSWNFAREQ